MDQKDEHPQPPLTLNIRTRITNSEFAQDASAFLFRAPSLVPLSPWYARANNFTQIFSLVFWIYVLYHNRAAFTPLRTSPLAWSKENLIMAWGTWMQIAPRFENVLRRRGRDVAAKSVGLYITEILWGLMVGILSVEAMRERDVCKAGKAVVLGIMLLGLLALEMWIKVRSRRIARLEGEENGGESRHIVD